MPARERALREEGRPQAYVALECDDAVLTMLKAQKERCNELERELARERALRTELEAASEQRSLADAAAELQFAQCRESATSLDTESDFLRWGSPCVSSTASSIWTGASGSREAQVARETEFTNILEASQATALRMSEAIQSRQKRSDELRAEHAAQAERAAQADRASHAEFTGGAEETGDVPTSPQSGVSPPRPRRTPASSSSSKRGSGSSSTVNVPFAPVFAQRFTARLEERAKGRQLDRLGRVQSQRLSDLVFSRRSGPHVRCGAKSVRHCAVRC